ncbi:MAG: hypothetical protein FJW40_23810 [Acidobacteria bacterium]|nr:hypothetical protein [Acidobacteriota bacterium]
MIKSFSMVSPAAAPPGERRKLDSWKQIAAYLDKSERTVRRWEKTEGLPVHKHVHLQRPSVFAYQDEIDQWLDQRRQGPAPLVEATKPAVSNHVALWAAGLGVLAALVTWLLLPKPEPTRTLVSAPFTAFAGEEYNATFSPDRKAIAFFWRRAEAGLSGIYRKQLDSNSDTASPIKVASDELNFSPAWSPDGRWIAYLRRNPAGEYWLRLMTPEGAEDRALTLLGSPGNYSIHVLNLSWGPDSRWLMVRPRADQKTIKRVTLDGVAMVVAQSHGSIYSPAVAPAGKAMIYQKREGVAREGYSEVILQDLDGEGSPAGEPRTIYHTWGGTRGLAWSPSGREIVMCAELPGQGYRLFRVALDGSTEKQGVPNPLSDRDCMTASISSPAPDGSAYLLYGAASQVASTALFTTSLDRLQQEREFAPSSRASVFPRFSPDGRSVAFLSDRSGQREVWRAGADGNQAVRLTTGAKAHLSLAWSPDGRRLMYSSGSSGAMRMMAVSAEGGPSELVPLDGQHIDSALWSEKRDLIYYKSSSQLWQARPDGTERRVLWEGNTLRLAGESSDGRSLFVVLNPFISLLRIPLDGGAAERSEVRLASYHTAVTREWLYFVKDGDRELCRMPRAGGAPQCFGAPTAFEKSMDLHLTLFGFTVSPDDKQIVWSWQEPQIDLELIRDFR